MATRESDIEGHRLVLSEVAGRSWIRPPQLGTPAPESRSRRLMMITIKINK